METLYKLLKQFLIEVVNPILEEHDDTIPLFNDNNVKFGTIDPFKNPTQKMLCSIYPNEQETVQITLADVQTSSNLTITVVSKNDSYEKILSQTCLYNNAICEALGKNYNMEVTIDDVVMNVDNIEVGTRKFYPDAGIAEKQATATEIELTIYTTNAIGE